LAGIRLISTLAASLVVSVTGYCEMKDCDAVGNKLITFAGTYCPGTKSCARSGAESLPEVSEWEEEAWDILSSSSSSSLSSSAEMSLVRVLLISVIGTWASRLLGRERIRCRGRTV
jgi:hypothetical protein